MSKVTIKFWNVEKGKYEDDSQWIAIDRDGDIILISDAEYSDDFTVEVITSGIEPHFYKDGERIA